MAANVIIQNAFSGLGTAPIAEGSDVQPTDAQGTATGIASFFTDICGAGAKAGATFQSNVQSLLMGDEAARSHRATLGIVAAIGVLAVGGLVVFTAMRR